MSTISIFNIAGVSAKSGPDSCTIIVRPATTAGPEWSEVCGPRGFHIVRLSNPPYPDERYQFEAWSLAARDIAQANANGEILIVAPDVVDFVSGEFARYAMYFARVVITVVADTVAEAVMTLVSHDIPADQIEEAYFVDLTGNAPTLSVEVADRVLPAPTVAKIPTPGRWSLDEYVASNHYALAHRWKHEKFDPAFTGVFEIEDLRHHVRNGRAERFDLGFRTRKLRHADRKGVISIADRVPGFGLINKAGVLEVWVHVTLEQREYTAIFQEGGLRAHGFDYQAENGRKYDLDHAFGRSVSLTHSRANYVLLAPLSRSVNRSWGHIEKYSALGTLGHPTMQQASWFSGPKMFSLYAPSRSRDGTIAKGISRIARELQKKDAIYAGERTEAISGLRELYQEVWRGQDIRRGIANPPKAYPAERFEETTADLRRAREARRREKSVNQFTNPELL